MLAVVVPQGWWEGGSCRVVVHDHGGPDMDGPRNGEDHVGESGVLEKSSLDGWVEAAMAT